MSSRKALPGLRVWRMQRVESIDANPRTFEQRAATFAASVPESGRRDAAGVADRRRDGIVSQLFAPARFGDSGALALAQAVGAGRSWSIRWTGTGIRSDDGDGLVATGYGIVLPARRCVGWVERDPGAPLAHSVQAGANPAEVARLLAGSLRSGAVGGGGAAGTAATRSGRRGGGGWCTGSAPRTRCTTRSASKPLVLSMLAGGDDQAAVVSLLDQMVASLPGFDLGTRVEGRGAAVGAARHGRAATGRGCGRGLLAVPVLTVLTPTLQRCCSTSGCGRWSPGLPDAGAGRVLARVPAVLPLLASDASACC